jgi:hypothetical protein
VAAAEGEEPQKTKGPDPALIEEIVGAAQRTESGIALEDLERGLYSAKRSRC